MRINYNKLTAESLEEYVEFIDWSIIPYHLLTEDVRKLFGSIPQLKARLWFEDLLSKMAVKENEKVFPDCVFFIIENECFIELNFRKKDFWFSLDSIWYVLEYKFYYNYEYTHFFLKNVMKQYYEKIELELELKSKLSNFEVSILRGNFTHDKTTDKILKNLTLVPKKNS